MNVFVVDASVAVKWFVAEVGHEDAVELLADTGRLIAPDIIFAETANALLKKSRCGQVPPEVARSAILAVHDAIKAVVPTKPLVERATDLALQLNHSAYDCFYLACAEAADAVLVTADTTFSRKVIDQNPAGHVYTLENYRHLMDLEVTPMQVREVLSLMRASDDTLANIYYSLADDHGRARLDEASAVPWYSDVKLHRLLLSLPPQALTDLSALAAYGSDQIGHGILTWSDVHVQAPGDVDGLRGIVPELISLGWCRLFGRNP